MSLMSSSKNRAKKKTTNKINREKKTTTKEEVPKKKEEEEEEDQEQPEKKLTLELLEKPDDETKTLFARMDLKAFLDKAKTDLLEAGKDPRDAYIDLNTICWHDGVMTMQQRQRLSSMFCCAIRFGNTVVMSFPKKTRPSLES